MGNPEPTAGTAIPAALEERLAEVSRSLTAATGGQALCRLDGHVAPAKELEGRMAALLELRRALRADPDADMHAIADRWRRDLASRRAKGSSAAWLAYLAGGLAELEGVTAG